MALFTIMLMAVLPMLLQAGRNMRFAESNYRDHLMAQGMMLSVRDALLDGAPPRYAASMYASSHGVEFYSIWILEEQMVWLEFNSYGTPEAIISLTGGVAPTASDSHVVIAAIWNEDGNITGRAIGVAHLGLEGENEIP